MNRSSQSHPLLDPVLREDHLANQREEIRIESLLIGKVTASLPLSDLAEADQLIASNPMAQQIWESIQADWVVSQSKEAPSEPSPSLIVLQGGSTLRQTLLASMLSTQFRSQVRHAHKDDGTTTELGRWNFTLPDQSLSGVLRLLKTSHGHVLAARCKGSSFEGGILRITLAEPDEDRIDIDVSALSASEYVGRATLSPSQMQMLPTSVQLQRGDEWTELSPKGHS
jgi:hypothetical protein